jgi:hypothetical protein
MSKRKQRIGFRIVGADATSGDIIRLDAEALHDASLAIFGKRFDPDRCFRCNAARSHIRFIHEGDHSPAEHASGTDAAQRLGGTARVPAMPVPCPTTSTMP